MTSPNPFKEVPVGNEYTFEIERMTLQKGKSFSEDALRELLEHVNLFVATQIATRWDKTGEPPSALRVHVRCDVS